MKNEEAAVSVLICITILPSLLSVLLAFIGIKSLISLIAYTIGAFFLVRLKIRTSKKCGKGFWIVLLYLLLFIISVKYTISPKISEEKLENIVYNIFIPISLLLVLFRYKIDFSILETLFIKKIYRCSIFICIFLALLLMLGFTEKGEDIEGRDTIIGMRDAIWASRFVGFLLLPLIIRFLKEKRITILGVVGILCALFVMIKSGSRGPIFSMLIVVALYLLPQMRRGYKVLTIATVFIIYFAFVHLSTRMASDSAEYSNLERLELINAVFESKFNIIRGVGIGGFGMFVRGEDIYLYPHNMIIETYIETGLVGVFFLMAILFNLFKRGYRNSVWFMYCFYFFVNAMVSGDIAANNYFFVFATILLCIPKKQYSMIVNK